MSQFITDRTESDVLASKQLIQKVAASNWADLTTTEQNTYINEDKLYEDKGRFGVATAKRISEYLVELSGRYPTAEPWGSRTFRGTFDDSLHDDNARYFTIRREDFIAWVALLTIMYAGNPVDWDFNAKPYLDYNLLNRLEFLSEAIYEGRVSVETEICGAFKCGEEFIIFDQSLTS